MTVLAKATSKNPVALVLFGRDDAGKAHGSAFNEGDAELAAKAAELMGMRTLVVRTELEQALAAKLPRGRVFGSGKAFVPFIKATLLIELQTAALNSGLPPLKLIASGSSGESKASAALAATTLAADVAAAKVDQPTGWDDIAVGAIVLALAGPKFAEWYECVVLGFEGSDGLRLRYCDYPNAPLLVRQRCDVALMHPTHEVEPPLEPESSSVFE